MSDDRATPPSQITLVPPEPRSAPPARSNLDLEIMDNILTLMRLPIVGFMYAGIFVLGMSLWAWRAGHPAFGGLLMATTMLFSSAGLALVRWGVWKNVDLIKRQRKSFNL